MTSRWSCLALLLIFTIAISALPKAISTAFPTPRGDPDAQKPTGAKHPLLEFVESTPQIVRPARDRTSQDVKSWLAKGDLATAFGLTPFTTLEVPIFVNILAIGLDGSGNLGVKLEQHELERWMQHLDHIVAHNVLRTTNDGAEDDGPELEHTASTKIQQDARSHRRRKIKADERDVSRDAAKIQYRYHIRLIHLSPRVIEVVERYLAVHYRVENKDHTSFQVDAEVMSGLLDGLINHLHLDDAYNLFVLNPSLKWLTLPSTVPANSEISYGYRTGFSNEELDALLDTQGRDTAVRTFVKEFASKPERKFESPNGGASDHVDGTPQDIPVFVPPTPEQHAQSKANPTPQLQVLDHTASSEEWAAQVLAAPHFTGPQPLAMYLHQQLEHHPTVLRQAVGNPYASEDCLVDSWISRGRTAWIDITSSANQPKSWGPISGGEGVRSQHSVPDVTTFVSQWKKELAEEHAEDEFVDATYDKDAVAAERIILEDLLVTHKCGGGKPLKEVLAAPQQATEECLAIIEKLEDLLSWQEENEHKLVDSSSSDLKGKVKAPELHDRQGLSFFHDDEGTAGDGGNGNGGEASHAGGSHDASIEVDHFLAHLSATLSKALHHVFTPTVSEGASRPASASASSSTDPSKQLLSTGYYAQHISFHLYVLVNHQQYDPLANQFVEKWKYGLEQLRLGSQVFTYTIHKLTMDDDPALAMAYTSSMKTTVIPSILFDGRFTAIKRMYLDTTVLAKRLKGMELGKDDTPIQGSPDKSSSNSALLPSIKSREISLFLFSVEYPLPVLVDKFYQAVAVQQEGIVVAVQSNLHLWESPLTCNHRPLFWDLRDPLRAILSSTSQLLGGLLPLHETASAEDSNRRVQQDWLWSVGNSPNSLTSTLGLEWSQIQRDTIHRNYVVQSWEKATKLINQQVARLKLEKTTQSNRMLAGIDDEVPPVSGDDTDDPDNPSTIIPPGRFTARRLSLQNAYIAFTDTMEREMIPAMELFHFDVATQLIEKLYKQANDFTRLVGEITEWNRKDRCAAGINDLVTPQSVGSSFQLTWHWYMLTAIICVAILLYRLLVARNDKPKLN